MSYAGKFLYLKGNHVVNQTLDDTYVNQAIKYADEIGAVCLDSEGGKVYAPLRYEVHKIERGLLTGQFVVSVLESPHADGKYRELSFVRFPSLEEAEEYMRKNPLLEQALRKHGC